MAYFVCFLHPFIQSQGLIFCADLISFLLADLFSIIEYKTASSSSSRQLYTMVCVCVGRGVVVLQLPLHVRIAMQID